MWFLPFKHVFATLYLTYDGTVGDWNVSSPSHPSFAKLVYVADSPGRVYQTFKPVFCYLIFNV